MSGSRFADVERDVSEGIVWRLQSALSMHQRLQQLSGEETTVHLHDIDTCLGTMWPSSALMAETFLADFKQHSEDYVTHMQHLGGEVVSADHTFKVSVNIGYQRAGDQSWVTLYDSLFCLMNKDGAVLSFQLVKDRCFETVASQFTDVQERNRRLGKELKVIALDNCCQWRDKLQNLLGDVRVVLDIFHAVQRITKTIPMGNVFRRDLLVDIRNLFRRPGDQGPRRTQRTPDQDTLKENFAAFRQKWTGVASNEGQAALSQETHKALTNLERHIEKGCLSEIDVGVGTNKNERLHQLLNHSAVAVARIGPEMANALLTLIFYRWNESKNIPPNVFFNTDKVIKPIWSHIDMEVPQVDPDQDITDTRYNPSPPHESVTTDTGEEASATQTTEKASTSNLSEVESSMSEEESSMFHDVAHKLDTVFSCLKKKMSARNLNRECFYEAYRHPEVAFGNGLKDGDNHEQMLNNLSSLKMQAQETSTLPQVQHMLSATYDSNTLKEEMISLANSLRRPVYTVTGESPLASALVPFLHEDGIYDAYPLCLAVSQQNGRLRVYMTSEAEPAPDEEDEDQTAATFQPKPKQDIISCRCGESRTDGTTQSCVHKPGASYRTRCKCYRTGRGCSLSCNCKQCANPMGERPTQSSQQKRKQKLTTVRRLIRRKPGQKFVTEELEIHRTGPWTDLDTFALYLVNSKLQSHKRNKAAVQTRHLCAALEEVRAVCVQRCNGSMEEHSEAQCSGKVQHMKKRYAVMCDIKDV